MLHPMGHNINNLSECCHLRGGAIFQQSSREFNLVYLNIPNTERNPVYTLENIGQEIKPIAVKVTIARIAGREEYNMGVLVIYDTTISITSSKYFSIYGIEPYVIFHKLRHEYRAIFNKFVERAPTNRLPHQLAIEGEDADILQISSMQSNCTYCELPDEIIPRSSRKNVKLSKSAENNDMTPRYNFHHDRFTDLLEGTIGHPIIIGDKGIGKTNLAKYYLNYNHILVVEDLDRDLRKFDHRIHKSILFENIDFSECDPSYVLNLMFCPNRVIQCGTIKIFIPTYIQYVFTTRDREGIIFDHNLNIAYRGCVKMHITSKFYD